MGAVYDGLYIALAIREDLKVLTADDRPRVSIPSRRLM